MIWVSFLWAFDSWISHSCLIVFWMLGVRLEVWTVLIIENELPLSLDDWHLSQSILFSLGIPQRHSNSRGEKKANSHAKSDAYLNNGDASKLLRSNPRRLLTQTTQPLS